MVGIEGSMGTNSSSILVMDIEVGTLEWMGGWPNFFMLCVNEVCVNLFFVCKYLRENLVKTITIFNKRLLSL